MTIFKMNGDELTSNLLLDNKVRYNLKPCLAETLIFIYQTTKIFCCKTSFGFLGQNADKHGIQINKKKRTLKLKM